MLVVEKMKIKKKRQGTPYIKQFGHSGGVVLVRKYNAYDIQTIKSYSLAHRAFGLKRAEYDQYVFISKDSIPLLQTRFTVLLSSPRLLKY